MVFRRIVDLCGSLLLVFKVRVVPMSVCDFVHLGFLIYDFLTDRKSSILGVWAAPGGRDSFQKDGGLRPPPFCKVSRPPGAAQTPKIDDLRSVKKSYIKTLGVSTDKTSSSSEGSVSELASAPGHAWAPGTGGPCTYEKLTFLKTLGQC